MAQGAKPTRSASTLFALWMALLMLAVALMMLMLNRIYARSMLEESREVAAAGLRSAVEGMDAWKEQAGLMLRSIGNNTRIQELMAQADLIGWYRQAAELEEGYQLNLLMDGNITNLIYLDRLGHVVSCAGSALYQKDRFIGQYEAALPNKDPLFALYQATIAPPSRLGEWSLMNCLPIYATKTNLGVKLLDPIGAAFLQVNPEKLLRRTAAGAMLEGTGYYLFSPEVGCIASTTSEPPPGGLAGLLAQWNGLDGGSVQTECGAYALSMAELEGMPFQIVQLRREESAQLLTNRLYRYELGMLAGILILLLLASGTLYQGVMRPLNQLTRHISLMRERGQPLNVALSGVREMLKIQDEFNALTQERERFRNNLLIAQRDVHEKEMQRRHFEALSMISQINPHFLANTLEMIRAMALEGDGRALAGLMRDVSRIYRYSIQSPQSVRLEDELTMLNAYLHIQLVRFGERFTCQIQATDEARHQLVPKMILQPIVENAILHGLELQERPGRLTVTCALCAEALVITVDDDGRGMDEGTRAAVQAQLLDPDGRAARDNLQKWSIGILNVHSRIRGQYGEGSGVFLEEKEGPGARFTLRIKRSGRPPDDLE